MDARDIFATTRRTMTRWRLVSAAASTHLSKARAIELLVNRASAFSTLRRRRERSSAISTHRWNARHTSRRDMAATKRSHRDNFASHNFRSRLSSRISYKNSRHRAKAENATRCAMAATNLRVIMSLRLTLRS